MRILVISDIHANLVALEAVLADAKAYEAVWCLGDLVGYGPNPNECVERVRGLKNLTCLVGNHDKAVLGELDVNTFNQDAKTAILWTRDTLTPDNFKYLQSLQPLAYQDEFTLVHASPRQPIWEYILNLQIARDNFPHFHTRYCLVGHTHVPVVYYEVDTNGECVEAAADYEHPVTFNSHRLIINPGSVGQPRDSNPDAAYAFLDFYTLVWEYRRIPYDIAATQNRMRAAHLPDRLVLRIAYGW